jgi:hypothetical protein
MRVLLAFAKRLVFFLLHLGRHVRGSTHSLEFEGSSFGKGLSPSTLSKRTLKLSPRKLSETRGDCLGDHSPSLPHVSPFFDSGFSKPLISTLFPTRENPFPPSSCQKVDSLCVSCSRSLTLSGDASKNSVG